MGKRRQKETGLTCDAAYYLKDAKHLGFDSGSVKQRLKDATQCADYNRCSDCRKVVTDYHKREDSQRGREHVQLSETDMSHELLARYKACGCYVARDVLKQKPHARMTAAAHRKDGCKVCNQILQTEPSYSGCYYRRLVANPPEVVTATPTEHPLSVALCFLLGFVAYRVIRVLHPSPSK